MQKILSSFDLVPDYHVQYPSIMQRFVDGFTTPIPVFGWDDQQRVVVGHIVKLVAVGIDLHGEYVPLAEYATYGNGQHLHVSWAFGDAFAKQVGITEGFFTKHPHAIEYTFDDEDFDDSF